MPNPWSEEEEGADLIHLALDRDKWRTLLNMIMNVRIS
jgi:hypothetical protein